MDIIQIVGLGLIATFLALVVKEQKPMFAFLLTVFVGVIIFIFLVDEITKIIEMLESIARNANINMVYLQTILKIIGIAYIAEFGAQIAKDAGQAAIATKIELAGKILILVMAIPILTAVIEMVLALLPTS
ncbi:MULTISPECIES: stage III sporulation protein AD [Alkalihalophilus]|uniref:Stage III sporulation protein AD n=1 Tax=Alkalihalophilus pseudofirmus TaxID=79885 RepID=A0AAJ2NNE4_ALKPS|nr:MULTISPECIES: stage III sporulation protein AD [Alkalihalophilus]MDV2885559.1 stage III sporulation protein AD [Alkalihalophilus pseudofirmus]MEC2073826.1 stage III sporulation protein AD [Alkalihalophilus marmarensis]MED1601120.1 stage III sporulation protein AD [Alkalihalophilus marmarensis]OLS39422.1 stage III sporulation protein AD [Alkalihalophilus pseudofirmus]WEG19103.1 stage III sporulation protein AD [Alkalihalophilus pseudofirmus]